MSWDTRSITENVVLTAAPGPLAAVDQAQFERADLTSGVGVLVLGVGLGALVGLPRLCAVTLVLVGTLLHGWGMLRKHRLQRTLFGPPLRWVSLLYGVC